MMSAADDPTVAAKAASTAASMATPPNNDDGHTRKQVWRFIYADITFMGSIIGVLYASEIILSLLSLISVSVPKSESCSFLYSSRYSYFEFTSSSCFITSAVWYCFYVFGVTRKLSFVRWDIGEMIWCGFYGFNFLISSGVVAGATCYQDGYKAATAFGFICLIVIVVHGVFTFRELYARYHEGKSAGTSGTDTEAGPDGDKF